MVPFAQGSDGGGSIRIPASINGIFGIKPTRGRISNAPYGGDVTGLGTNGPLARTVRDAAAMLDAMAGPVLGDPAWAPPLPPGETFLGWADRAPGRLRIGRYLESPMPDVELEPEVRDGVRGRVAACSRASATTSRTSRPGCSGPDVLPSFERVWALSGTTLPVPRGPGRRAAPADPRAARPRAGDVGAGGDGGDDGAAAVLPPLPAGDRRSTTSSSRRSAR